MSKYFAKYLSVEEEIKEGDALLHDGTILFTIEELPKSFVNLANERDDKKVKLFLCSRDIQVGDTFNSANGTDFICEAIGEEKVYSVGGLHSSVETVGHDRFYAYKVIGEISPNAIWVKEGDELTEEQLGIYTDDTLSGMVEFVPYNCIPEDNWNDLGSPDIIIGILCPTCKTFH